MALSLLVLFLVLNCDYRGISYEYTRPSIFKPCRAMYAYAYIFLVLSFFAEIQEKITNEAERDSVLRLAFTILLDEMDLET